MILDTYFKDFLSNINLTKNQISRIKNTHETLRDRLKNDEELSLGLKMVKNPMSILL